MSYKNKVKWWVGIISTKVKDLIINVFNLSSKMHPRHIQPYYSSNLVGEESGFLNYTIKKCWDLSSPQLEPLKEFLISKFDKD